MTHDHPTLEESKVSVRPKKGARECLAIVQVWRPEVSEREGEVMLLPCRGRPERVMIGRSSTSGTWLRQRPGGSTATGPLSHPKISRRHLEVQRINSRTIEVELLGQGTLLDPNAQATERCQVSVGETFGLAGRGLFYLTLRPERLSHLEYFDESLWPTFAQEDGIGIVGESAAAWRLREAIARIAKHSEHTLVTGVSGVGKELAAQGIHALSTRAAGPWICRNAATIPEGLVSAELFGNRQGYV